MKRDERSEEKEEADKFSALKVSMVAIVDESEVFGDHTEVRQQRRRTTRHDIAIFGANAIRR